MRTVSAWPVASSITVTVGSSGGAGGTNSTTTNRRIRVPTLPAASVAVMTSVCSPSARPVRLIDVPHTTAGPPSSEQVSVSAPSLAPTAMLTSWPVTDVLAEARRREDRRRLVHDEPVAGDRHVAERVPALHLERVGTVREVGVRLRRVCRT